MKKCARCDTEYDDAYDGCPTCARSSVRCPTCGKDYDASYAHCPTCAAAAVLQPKAAGAKPGSKGPGTGCVVLLVIAGLMVWGFNSCAASGAANMADNPALAAQAQTAIAAYKSGAMSSLVDHITAQADGTVIITLNQTSAALAGASGTNGAREIGAGYNSLVLAKVPEAKSVSTFDANNKMLELSTRK